MQPRGPMHANGPARPRGHVTFRIITNADDGFLFRLYSSTREWEFALTIWSEADKQRFLRSQFDIQTRAYASTYLGAVHRIIQLDGIDVGRLIVDRRDDLMLIIDLSLLPEYRGRGIGTDLLRSLLNEALGGKVPVRLHVERNSPALSLYLRHDFEQVGVHGNHLALEWRPQLGPREI
ncbi:MAG: GNAT family N-acetyltransferase [Rhizobiales bacterium]|nr:GNAT family N-acetyltransferase [Hyphomicrobiales bacterium]